MSYVDKVTYVQNSHGFDIEGQAVDDNGNVLDLTEFTVLKFRMRKAGSTTTKVEGDASKVDAANGKWKYAVQTTDLDTVGTFQAQLVCRKGDPVTKEVTVKGLTIIVAEQIPAKV